MSFNPQTQETANRLLAALDQNSELLFLVLAGLHEAGYKVAGPWLRAGSTSTSRVRHDHMGRKLALVQKDSDRAAFLAWRASLAKTVGEKKDGERLERGFPSEGEALSWCDMKLIEHGYRLTTEPGRV